MDLYVKMMAVIKSYFSGRELTHCRIIQFSRLSVLANAAMGLVKIDLGFYSLSVFLCVNGLYNICI